MAKIYVNQTALRILLKTDSNIDTNSIVKIKYIKPDGADGEFSANLLENDPSTIYYDVNQNDLDQVGDWKFWAYVTFPNNKTVAGEPSIVEIFEEGK